MPAPAPPDPESRLYLRLAVAFVGLGVVVRLVRFALDFPPWADELMVCVNFFDRDYRTILRQLDHGQICPPLFLWAQLAAFQTFGGGGLALRLVPTAAAVLALVLFLPLARRTGSPHAAFAAVGLLAVAAWPISMSHFAKPYATDLLAAVGLQLAAVAYLRAPSRGRLAAVAGLLPVGVLGSYTAAFVGGGVCLALLPAVWRRGWAERLLFAAGAAGMLAAFGFDLQVGKEQFEGEAVKIRDFLLSYWRHGFPPDSPLGWPGWLLDMHTGRMFAYPLGDANYASSLTLVLFLVGVREWVKAKRWPLLVLFLTPFALNLLAAVLHRYPYGGCCRLSQHLAPAICVLAGTGAAAVGRWLAADAAGRVRGAVLFAALLACIGLGNAIAAVAAPFHDEVSLWGREVARTVYARLGPADRLVVLGPLGPDQTCIQLGYHLRRGGRAEFEGDPTTPAAGGRVWVLDNTVSVDGVRIERPPASGPPGWACGGVMPYSAGNPGDPVRHFCEVRVYGPPGVAPPAPLPARP